MQPHVCKVSMHGWCAVTVVVTVHVLCLWELCAVYL